MKKFWLTLILCLTCAFCAVGFAACGNNTETSGNTPTERTGGNETKAELISAEGFTMEDDGGKITVSKDTETFSFLNKIAVSDNATWMVSTDEYGMNAAVTKTVPLYQGDNAFFIIVTSGDGKTVNVYPMTVHRISVFTVRFNTNGDYYYYDDSIAPQSIEEGYCATEPTVIPVKLGYTFNGWDFDFTTPITNYITINAIWEVKPEMANFEFVSTATTCTISNVKDKTVTEIIIPDYVTYIPSFQGCTALQNVTIGNGVTSIGSQTFSGCSGLTSIIVDDNNPNYSSQDGILYNKGKTEIVAVPQGISGEIVLPSTLTSIGEYAFYECRSLTSITIPNSVTSIGGGVFSGCSSLENITIPFVGGSKSATSASSSTLFGYIFGSSSYTGGTATEQYYTSYSYTTYYIPSSLKTVTVTDGNILYGAFYNCSSLTSVTIGNSVTSIEDGAFAGCSGLTSVTIPDSVTSIGYVAFAGCSGLTSITIGNGVTSIGERAFAYCSSLTSVYYTGTASEWASIEGLEYILGYIIDIMSSVTLYINNEPVTDVVLENITVIKPCAFADCSSLTSITIPDSVTSIGYGAFAGCSSLTSVTIGSSVTSIGEYAFWACSSLTSVTFKGIKSQWQAINKGSEWKYNVPSSCVVHCTDGDINIANA